MFIHRVITFNQRAWLKSYIVMNSDLRKKSKKDFKKGFYQVDGKTVGK